MDNRNLIDRRSTEWDFLKIVFLVGLPIGAVVILFILARKGDQAAIVALVALAVLVLLTLGVVCALAIIDRLARLEQIRRAHNTQENMALLIQQQRAMNSQIQAQGRLSRDVLTHNQQLQRMLPSGQDVLDVDALTWDDDVLVDLDL